MYKAITISLLLLLNINVSAQWTKIYSDSIFLEVLDIHFLSSDTGFVCGNDFSSSSTYGLILGTFDGGISWPIQHNLILTCYFLDFTNSQVGYSGGHDGGVYRTLDGGLSWDQFSSVTSTGDFEDLEFITDSVAFVKTYDWKISKSIDGGESWNHLPNTTIGSGFYSRKNNSIFFLNDSIGFVVGDQKILKTEDQGNTWNTLFVDSNFYMRSIHMFNRQEGIVVGSFGKIASTTDGGANWNIREFGNEDFRDIDFVTDSIGFITGGGHYYLSDSIGLILRTKDRGQTWETIALSQSRLNSFQFIDSVAYVVGNYGNIYKNSNYKDLIDYEEIVVLDHDFKIWPNPVIDNLYFNTPLVEKIEFKLFDSQGKQHAIHSVSSNSISLSHLPVGIYILQSKIDSKVYLNKLVRRNNSN